MCRLLKGGMNKKKLICSIVACSVALSPMTTFAKGVTGESNINVSSEREVKSREEFSNQPIASYWFPEDLLNWSPENDKDAVFNKSTIPLAERVDKDRLETVNENQSKDVKIAALSIMNESTTGNPSQGFNEFSSNTFSYWQYIDSLVYWGGSAGEGIIVPPSADVTDSAHKNGVPVLGTVFFPPGAYGGNFSWVKEFIQKDENGNFPMADKLIEVAVEYGFDGWFINQETAGGNAQDAKDMQEFIKYFKENAPEGIEIMWYDSMTNSGSISWQNQLNDRNKMFMVDDAGNKVSDSMFLNFWWSYGNLLRNSRDYANNNGIDPYDLYAGIDVQANGYNTGISWDQFAPNGKNPYVSLGLYCPSWTYFSSNSQDEFMEKESTFWVNKMGDPSEVLSNASNSTWRGLSNYAVEKTVVNSIPFITNFSMGNGEAYYVNGEVVSEEPWNNRSLNDIMPTYRWIINNEDGNLLKADMDFETAYYGGNSIKLEGNLSENKSSTIKLYSADLLIPSNIEFSTVAKANNEGVKLDLVLQFHDGSEAIIEGDKDLGVDWTKVVYNMSPFEGKSIKNISYKLSSDTNLENIKVNLGNITVKDNNQSEVVDIELFSIDEAEFNGGINAGLRLSWTIDGNKENINHYEVYRVNEDGSKEFLGATPNTSYFVGNLKRVNSKEINTDIEVVAINKNYESGNSKTATLEWPEYPAPEAKFEVSKTLVAPGESVTFTNTSSEVTENVEWVFDGANIETSTEDNPTVTYAKEGVYSVTLKAKNSSGEDIEIMEEGIVVTEDAKNIYNMALNKSTTASGYVSGSEAPRFAVDGSYNTKWCAVGNGPHWITIDLGEDKLIGSVGIKHAQAGGESQSMNTRAYTLSVSSDGENFEEVYKKNDNEGASSLDNFKPAKGRYVKLKVDKSTQGGDGAARIYEVEVNGIDYNVKNDLKKLINSSKEDLSNAVEGIEIGNYHIGAKADLEKFITSAEGVYNNENSSEEEVKNIIKDLENALDRFNKLVIDEFTGDINKDGVINLGDLALVSRYQGNIDNDNELSVNSDLNLDGVVDQYEVQFITEKMLN